MPPSSEHSLAISASPELIWKALTTPELMKRWMSEPEMELEIYSRHLDFYWRGTLHVLKRFVETNPSSASTDGEEAALLE